MKPREMAPALFFLGARSISRRVWAEFGRALPPWRLGACPHPLVEGECHFDPLHGSNARCAKSPPSPPFARDLGIEVGAIVVNRVWRTATIFNTKTRRRSPCNLGRAAASATRRERFAKAGPHRHRARYARRPKDRMRLRHEGGSGGACDQSPPAVWHGCRRLWWRAMGGIRGWRIHDRPAWPPRPAGPLETLSQPTQGRCDSDCSVQDRTGDRRFVCERVGRIRVAPCPMAPLSNGFSPPLKLDHPIAFHVAGRCLASTAAQNAIAQSGHVPRRGPPMPLNRPM